MFLVLRHMHLTSPSIQLPLTLNSLTQLTSLSLQNNHFSCPIPSISNLSSLSSVLLNSNNFSSVSHRAFSGLISLQTLSVADNPGLGPWAFPDELVGSPNLVSFFGSNANIVGPIPDLFDRLMGLIDLRLSYNGLNGSLPGSLKGSSLQTFWVNNNPGLSGSVRVLSAMTQLKQVWFHANGFTGTIPDLSRSTVLLDLQLRDNQLTGPVPSSVMSLPNLLNVSLQNNLLQGPYPDFPKRVEQVEVGNNVFCKNETGDCDVQVSILLDCVLGFDYPIKLAQDWQGNDACN